MRPRYGPWSPMNMSNGMRPPMRGRGGGPGGPPMRGMGPRPPPYPGMGPPMRHFGPSPMGPRGPPNRGPGPMMPRMRPHMLPPMMMRPQRPMRPPIKKMTKVANNDGKIKKKKLKFRSFYVTRPWVNDELRAEIAKKDALFDQAKSSNKADDWASFKEQKDKCVHMYSALKLEFIGQHPEEDVGKIMAELNSNKKQATEGKQDQNTLVDAASIVTVEVKSEPEQADAQADAVQADAVVFSADEDEGDEYLCEPCDRTFDEEESYREHLQEHQTCGIDGCQFNAHQLLVLAHIKMQHSSGLYDQIRNISTPEDIKRWREQRRKNYPNKINIELRYQQQAEMLKRGERIGPNKNRFGRTRNALAEKRERQKLARKKRKRQLKKKKPDEHVSLIDEKADWNGCMFPFRGTRCLDEGDSSDDESHLSISDDEWDCYENGGESEEPVLNNALGALMGAYQSDSDEDDIPLKKPKIQSTTHVVNHANQETITTEANKKTSENNLEITNLHETTDNGDDDMIEIPIKKSPVSLPDKATELKSIDRKRAIPVTATSDDMPIPPKNRHMRKPAPPEKVRHPRRPTLLQKLLDKEIRHERNVILQCVRYVVNNNFFIKPKNECIMPTDESTNDESIAPNATTSAPSCNINEGASTSKC